MRWHRLLFGLLGLFAWKVAALYLGEEVAAAKRVAVYLEKVEELKEIMGYGVMSTPGVVVDGKVVHAGGIPSRDTRSKAGWHEMSRCCSSDKLPSGKHPCPLCGRTGVEVGACLLRWHIQSPWRWPVLDGHYFFCAQPQCPTVYFGDDGLLIRQDELRTPVGVKMTDPEAPLCYCFGISRSQAKNDPALRDFVVAVRRAGQCACDTLNPSGRCCLKDFPKTKAKQDEGGIS